MRTKAGFLRPPATGPISPSHVSACSHRRNMARSRRDSYWTFFQKSGVSKRTRKTHRVILPRLSDIVQDFLSLLATQSDDSCTEVFVLDFTDAFWQILMAFQERRHLVGTYAGRYWLFERSARRAHSRGPCRVQGLLSYYDVLKLFSQASPRTSKIQ